METVLVALFLLLIVGAMMSGPRSPQLPVVYISPIVPEEDNKGLGGFAWVLVIVALVALSTLFGG
jgi:hypothetical protein